MVRRILTPKQSLNKAYQKVTVFRDEFNLFRKNLSELLKNIDHEESEENVKNHLKDFLSNTYYKDKHLLNTKNKTDLVIYLDKKQDSKAGVLIEVKRPANKGEMITKKDLNRKAFHELILYYLHERIEGKNDEIKYLIATNIYEWFIFDAVLFENLFYKNTQLVKDYNNWKNDRKVSSRTDHFYNEIAKPYLDKLISDVTFTYFDLNEYKRFLNKTDKEAERKFIPLYKILSPVHLIKQPFANDSNSLDRNFYNELLYIVGLEEVKEKNKKLIKRKSIDDRDSGSFIENTMRILKTDQAIDRIKEPVKYGDQIDDQLYHIALELSLTWINRILFLKLLESQLFNYHKSNNYKFLNSKIINDYDELYKLFHQVLAVKLQEREGAVKDKYALVPYLNSSLFEISDLENQAIRISQLDNNAAIKIYKATVLKDKSGKKRTGTLTALEYLFEFLDAYNFTSEGKEEIEEEKKTLINASVLGLIFEKINGYKDGSYFTPGFITMYMCRETIRRAVVQKFNKKYDWKCETFEDLKNHLADRRNTKDILEANVVINSLKICDPAVGSGHFLVSALNEIIAIKSELGILADESGVVLNGYDVKIENDELIVTYNHGEELFEYHPPQKRATIIQQVQETLFREKQTIIENCLFGVDINPNSVSIARLRLWIELLKNAYYTKESNYTELETLPNIDINIKEGNSLVSRFDVSDDYSKLPMVTKQKIKTATTKYKDQVLTYKTTDDRKTRKKAEQRIKELKKEFEQIANPTDKTYKRIRELENKLMEEVLHFSHKEKDEWEERRKKLQKEYDKLKIEYELTQKTIYSEAFEWRFEFPEVLDEEGNFFGFDVVIGNPPYIGFQELTMKQFYNFHYLTAKGKYDIYVLFIELLSKISNLKSNNAFILPHKFLVADFGKETRKFLSRNKLVNKIIHFGEEMVFEDATTYTCITLFSQNNIEFSFLKCKPRDISNVSNFGIEIIEYIDLKPGGWVLTDRINKEIIDKVLNTGEKLYAIFEGIFQGIVSGDNDAFYLYDCKVNTNTLLGYSRVLEKEIEVEKDFCKPLLNGKNLEKWISNFDNTFILYPYYLNNGKTILYDEGDLKLLFPKSYTYFLQIKERLLNRGSEKMKYKSWFALWNSRKITRLSSKKIITPDVCYGTKMSLDSHGFFYHNDTSYSLILKKKIDIDYKYFLGVLNSKLIWFFLSQTGNILRGGYFRFKTNYMEPISIPINNKNMINLVTSKVNEILKKKYNNLASDVSKLESEIDEIVYQIYGLTEEEIKVVEGF